MSRNEDSTLISRSPLMRSNFSINAILSENPSHSMQQGSPVPSTESEPDESDDIDINVDFDSDNEGKYHSIAHFNKKKK